MRVSWVNTSRLPHWPWWAWTAAGLWAALTALAAALTAGTGAASRVCWFKAATHLPCPACGSGRAVLALARGWLLRAWALNPLLVTAATVAALGLLVRMVSGRSLRVAITRTQWYLVLAAGAVMLVANWAYLVSQGR